jgi:hypothetical protein
MVLIVLLVRTMFCFFIGATINVTIKNGHKKAIPIKQICSTQFIIYQTVSWYNFYLIASNGKKNVDIIETNWPNAIIM